MLPIDEALRRVLETARPLGVETVALAEADGRTLAEDVESDIDSPPYNKALVDGYAVRSADFTRRPVADVPPAVELAVVEEVVAGSLPSVALSAGRATRIMTGAPLPAGADAVVMHEHTKLQAEPGVPGGVVRCDDAVVPPGLNVLLRAASIRRGQTVLAAGSPLRPAEIGLLAEVGRVGLRVFARPRVAVLSTGDELVDASLVPGPGQVRATNGPMLLAALRRYGGVPIDLGIARDDHHILRPRLAEGLLADVLVVSGGVSEGVRDFVPSVLQELGVREVFHKIALRPGKPLWFGARTGASGTTLVFGLPGNPVASLLCCQLFVAAALARLSGRTVAEAPLLRARLGNDFQHRGVRTAYHPARLRNEGQIAIVETIVWQGSADLRTLSDANAWAIFPAGDRSYAAGEEIDCRPL